MISRTLGARNLAGTAESAGQIRGSLCPRPGRATRKRTIVFNAMVVGQWLLRSKRGARVGRATDSRRKTLVDNY
eukprot:11161402-Lingulodinium_polyedra.AAC.1